ncbi:MAG: hypothetical protein IPL26_17945 [Leptospiraceae bacterium]|nr:hypothetical protein [Leptospiraceae bacterium]
MSIVQDHTLVVGNNGIFYATDANWSGQLGNRTTTDANVPVVVHADNTSNPFKVDLVAINGGNKHIIARGRDFSAAIKEDGSIWVWEDDNGGGVFGNGSLNVQSSFPKKLNFMS